MDEEGPALHGNVHVDGSATTASVSNRCMSAP